MLICPLCKRNIKNINKKHRTLALKDRISKNFLPDWCGASGVYKE